ncbi:MAG: hypothetical protein JXB88_20620 [Spirochaetales bacterium]|nr:hypothetical protein [Spirochaetales bacterium]
MFRNNVPIPLEGLDTGEIEIIAYRNKQGGTWEDEIHRYVYVDSSRLWINLVQPNIYTTDILDTPYKMSVFHNPDEPADPLAGSNIQLTNDGSLKLKTIENTVIEETEFSQSQKKVMDVIETGDGNIFTLINENNTLKIYEKEYGSSDWQLRISRPDMYGYDICETDIGILLGVSNLFSSGDSGLYILQGTVLTNIVIGQPIPHVQFIKNNNGTIYLYGNDYSHLFSFNLYTLENDNGRLKTSVVKKEYLPNSLFITQFELSSDAYTAVIRTSDRRVKIFQKVENAGFREKNLDRDIYDPGTGVTRVIAGEYTTGDYNIYLLINKGESGNSAFTVMENKATHRLIPGEIELDFAPGETLVGADFKDNEFYFIHRINESDNYNVRKGHILFNYKNISLVTDGVVTNPYNAADGVDIVQENLRLFKTSHDTFYLGYGEELATTRLCHFTSNYPASAEAAFHYINGDIEGISGFHFEVDTIDLKSGIIDFGFAVMDETGKPVSPAIGQTPVSLPGFVEVKSDYFTVEKQYDAGIRKEIIFVEFTTLQGNNRYLSFYVRIHDVGNISPAVSNMTVHKKVPARLPRSADEFTYLPIHGFIHDPTVKEVYVQEIKLSLERDNSFTCNYRINSSENRVPVEISCINGARETATLKFNVELFESVNGLSNIVITNKEDNPVMPDNGNEYHTDETQILVSGKYYGLTGAHTRYELYTYDYSQGMERLVLKSRGVFTRIPDKELNPDYMHLGSGYESGTFSGEIIRLTPGKQRLIIYVENPGGAKHEYMIDRKSGLYPEIFYNLAEEEQKIFITNIEKEAITSYVFDQAEVCEKIVLDIHETSADTGVEPYVFSRMYIIHGEVLSLYKLTNLKIKSYSSDVKFSNGSTEIIIPLDMANRFEVRAMITMPEDCEDMEYHLAFIPTPPFLHYMRKMLRLETVKSFSDTYIVPDFAAGMAPSLWTPREIRSKEKSLRIGISRFIPAGTRLHLLVNYEEKISGELTEVNPGEGMYKLIDNGQERILTGVKYGRNRIQWRIVTRDGYTISSSMYAKPGMEDYIFQLEEPLDIQPTIIHFPVELQTYYDAEDSAMSLPGISISRDPGTRVDVSVNDMLIWNEISSSGQVVDGTISDTVNIYKGDLIEGLNEVKITYTEGDSNPVCEEYIFLYDSSNPRVKIIDCSYNDNVCIGAQKNLDTFAEGYIDSIHFNSVYTGSVYKEVIAEENILANPLTFSYTDGPPCALSITAAGIDDTDIKDPVFTISSKDGSYRAVSEPDFFVSGPEAHGIDIRALLPGRYIVQAEMLIKGRCYRQMYSFTKSDKSRFILKDITPLIIRDVEGDISFSLGYDDSYQVETDDAVFSGIAATINYIENDTVVSATLYVTQDYYYLQDKKQWLVFSPDDIEPTPLPLSGSCIRFSFNNITSHGPVSWDIHSFYFDAAFDASMLNLDASSLFSQGVIPDASMTVHKVEKQVETGNKVETIEYKLEVTAGSGSGTGGKEIFRQFAVGYLVWEPDGTGPVSSGEFKLNDSGSVDIYYDDILPGYGMYDCIISLKYKGESYKSWNDTLEWKKITEDFSISDTKSLDIVDFSLLHLDRHNGSAQVYLEYKENNIETGILYELTVISETSKTRQTYSDVLNSSDSAGNSVILHILDIEEGLSYVMINLRVEADNIYRHAGFTVYNSAKAPEVVLTNSVPSLIGYNNVIFSWRGYHEGVFKPDIAYSCNVDYQGWSAPNSEWRSIELFGLTDGYHNFRVKAVYDGEESPEVWVTFFVDIHKPEFDASKITFKKLHDHSDVLYAVKLTGTADAINDVSLNVLRCNGNPVEFNQDGSFVINEIPLVYDGMNEIVLTAIDKVGNFSEHTITVENNITSIIFPAADSIRFAPMTLVGRVNSGIDAKMEIYLSDPLTRDTGDGDFSGWKKAAINEDRVFFVEDVFINPGTASREAVTSLELAMVFESGTIFRRILLIRANEIVRPIDMELNTHTAWDPAGVMLTDFYHQRIIKLTGSLKVESFFGSFGDKEGQFIKPSHIAFHGNRLFIFDEGRFDIQVFGPETG